MLKSKVTIPVVKFFQTTRHIDNHTTMPVEQPVITQTGDIIIEAQCLPDELNESGVIIDEKVCKQAILDLKQQIYSEGLGEQTPEQFLTLLAERLQGVDSLRFKNAELDISLSLTESPESELTSGNSLAKDEFEKAINAAYDKLLAELVKQNKELADKFDHSLHSYFDKNFGSLKQQIDKLNCSVKS